MCWYGFSAFFCTSNVRRLVKKKIRKEMILFCVPKAFFFSFAVVLKEVLNIISLYKSKLKIMVL